MTVLGSVLTERKNRYTPEEANSLDLMRVEKIDFSGKVHLSPQKDTRTNMVLIKKGDLIISGINAEKGAISVYERDEDALATIHYSSYMYDSRRIDPNFLKWLLKSKYFRRELRKQVRGGIKTEIKAKKLLKLDLEIPELSGQKKHGALLGDIQNQASKVFDSVEGSQKKIRLLRNAILDSAISGSLTGVHKSKEVLKDNHSSLPPEWQWIPLNDLIDQKRGITYGIVKMGDRVTGGVKVLRCSDIKFRYIDTSQVRTVSEEISEQYSRTILKGGELLLNIRGTLGGCAIAPQELAGYNIAREVAMIPLRNGVNAEYILNVLTSPYFTKATLGNLRGIAYRGLNLGILRSLQIPIPPKDVQKAIVLKVKALLATVDRLDETVAGQVRTSHLLMPASIDKSFNKQP